MTNSKWKAAKAAKVEKVLGTPETFQTPYGAVVFYPKSPGQVTMIVLADGTAQRIRGLLKRTILALVFKTKANPAMAMNLN